MILATPYVGPRTIAATWAAEGGPFFGTAIDALYWAAEVLRTRRYPKLSRIYQQVVAAWDAENNEAPEAPHDTPITPPLPLPRDPDTRYCLAQEIVTALTNLTPDQAQLLVLAAWGDWADETRLRQALALQEKFRRQGVRVRLSYRYSLRRLGEILGHDHKYAGRRMDAALHAYTATLVAHGIVWQPGGESA
jgi:hypothetical protein